MAMFTSRSIGAGLFGIPKHPGIDKNGLFSSRERRKWILGWWLFSSCVAGLIATSYLTQSRKARQVSIPNLLSRLQVPLSEVTFLPDDRYTNTEDLGAIDPWAAIFPPGGGFISLRSDLDTGEMDYGSDPVLPDHYCVSMYHQLHCLQNLKMALLPASGSSNTTHDHHDHEHLAHCIQYLVQAVMCSGDMSLEKARVIRADGKISVKVNGWETKHSCRDWGTMFEFTAGLSMDSLGEA